MSTTEQVDLDRLSLADRLRERIKREGPIVFRDWMEAALYNPREGYYCRPGLQRWGRAGDYRTSPERSPLFGATFARYFSELYAALNAPHQWTILEPGAGRGEFAEQVLETLKRRFPRVFAATRYVIDELGIKSRDSARKRLARFEGQVEFGCLVDLPSIESGIIFSNELLDAFPVHRVTLRDGKLNEFYVGLGRAGEFEWTVGPPSTPRLTQYLESVGAQLVEGQIAEINLAVEDWLTQVASKLRNGYIIMVDYGSEAPELYETPERLPGTLRAFHRHQFADDVLTRPGEQDITTTVDWTWVRRVGEKLGFETVEFKRQDSFLLNGGLFEELEVALAESADAAEKTGLNASAREMILPNGMAASFQVLVQRRPSAPEALGPTHSQKLTFRAN